MTIPKFLCNLLRECLIIFNVEDNLGGAVNIVNGNIVNGNIVNGNLVFILTSWWGNRKW